MNNQEFRVHILNDLGISKAKAIADQFDMFLSRLLILNPEQSKEMALCRTKLEEASFFAKKAMAMEPENQKQESA